MREVESGAQEERIYMFGCSHEGKQRRKNSRENEAEGYKYELKGEKIEMLRGAIIKKHIENNEPDSKKEYEIRKLPIKTLPQGNTSY